ncbi:MAG: transcription termination/antitermination protein NusA [Actinomycetaceae bacterium]|nr:transcription termination/antitermination protein NusA [Actinomycetaceae bacterium]
MDIKMEELRVVESELGISADVLIEAIEAALLHAYQRVPGSIDGARVELDRSSGKVSVIAPEIDEDGNVIGYFDDTPGNFGRIATTTARSIIMQRLRDAESDRLLGSFKGKKGELISGVVQHNSKEKNGDLLVEVDDHEVVLRTDEQVPTEDLRHGERIRAYVTDVALTGRGVSVRISRTHPEFVRKLFELEVPEIQTGDVEIVSVAREAGHRTKIAVWSDDASINPKGACIGHNGQRVRAVMEELRGEKFDIINYSKDPCDFIAAALSPAQVLSVAIVDEESKRAKAIVPDGQEALAIGKEAQNVRLAAKLTGWAIDIRCESEAKGD